MKTMTCKDLGGTCAAPIAGKDLDEMSMNGYKHVKELAEGGDADHKGLLEKMNNQTEEEKKQWMAEMQPKFDAAPDA